MAGNYTITSEMSEISTQSKVNDTPFPKDDEGPEQIFGIICRDIRGICGEIQKETRKSCNVNTEINLEKTVVVPDVAVLLEKKTNIINQLTTRIKDSELFDYPHFRGEATMSIPVMMTNEASSCQQAVQLLNRVNSENEQYLESLKEYNQFCDEMEEAHGDSDVSNELLTKISFQVNKEFKQCRRLMENIIEMLFPNTNYLDVFGRLFEHYSKQKDEWYEVADKSDMMTIFSLIQDGLAIRNPNNSLQVKLNI